MSGRIEFHFQDLPGVAGGRLWGVPRHSINAIVEGLSWHRLIWDTGDAGASIIVYRDDALRFRCFFHDRAQHDGAHDRGHDGAPEGFVLKESQVFTTRIQVGDWLRQWHPRLQMPQAATERSNAA